MALLPTSPPPRKAFWPPPPGRRHGPRPGLPAALPFPLRDDRTRPAPFSGSLARRPDDVKCLSGDLLRHATLIHRLAPLRRWHPDRKPCPDSRRRKSSSITLRRLRTQVRPPKPPEALPPCLQSALLRLETPPMAKNPSVSNAARTLEPACILQRRPRSRARLVPPRLLEMSPPGLPGRPSPCPRLNAHSPLECRPARARRRCRTHRQAVARLARPSRVRPRSTARNGSGFHGENEILV